jgi:O-antigen/teichoic acid export membrane protein
VIGVMVAVLAASWIQVMTGWFHARKLFPPLKESSIPSVFSKDDKKQFLQYSTPLYLVMFVDLILQQTDGVMIGYFRSAAEVGIYEVSFRFTPFLLLALGSTAQMFQPYIADYFARNELSKISLLYKQVTKIVFIITLPIFLILTIFPVELLAIFGKEFTKGSTCLIILSSGFLFQALTGHTNPILALSGHPRLLFYNNSFMTIMNIILNFFFIQWWGIVGAAIATSVSIVVSNLCQLFLVYYLFKIHPYSWSCLKPVLAALITGSIIYSARYFLSIMEISVFYNILLIGFLLILYLVILYVLKISADEKMLLIEFKNKFLSKIGFLKK